MTKDKKNPILFKRMTDLAMTVLLLFLMGYQFWGELFHEWAGAGMFVLFIVHHILNLGWYRNLLKGRYSPVRMLWLLVNVLVFAAMLGMMISGIILSRHVFTFLPIRGGASFARILHMVSVYWGFVLMALHLGLHWNMVLGMAGKIRKKEQPVKVRRILSVVLSTAIALYGCYVFFKRSLPDYMFLKTQFVFLDFGESRILFFMDHLAMMGLFIYLSHYGKKLLQKLGKPQKGQERKDDREERKRKA
ncbi:DUF4405 domain-containing protein [Murimonas intestini]|uniref:DUF4405 domain-containing protein n=1 Tax=Murimonas intestini TaxID=1337051 RepID=UPI001FAA7FB9|nr:DUF4405 domain-containing protein [Murimonas intestini]